MREADFDVIVVGSGCAGAIAAYVAARRGKSVLVVDRGESAGSKNMTGGRIYAHSLRGVFDAYAGGGDVLADAPFERRITHERIALMDPGSCTTIDFTSGTLGETGRESYSVLRATFDQWLADRAEGAGASYINGIAVEELLKDGDGAVTGIRAGDDEITAHVVIVAEGANSILSERCLGVPRPRPAEMAVGIKEVFELPADQIEGRFLCPEGEGASMLFVGDCTHGNVGGGFLYTNRDSISLGLVVTIEGMSRADTTVCQAMEDFKNHPAVAPVIRGARMVEHSGHMVPEGGYDMVPRHTFDGALIAGDAAMLCMNLGYMVRGMDLAVASGRFAAEAACDAIDAGDVSAAGLASYGRRLEGSFVVRDLETFRLWPRTMAGWDDMFTDYPVMVREVLDSMFSVDGTPQTHLMRRIMPIVRRRGMFRLLRQVRGALKAL